jgi:hypothetical protein
MPKATVRANARTLPEEIPDRSRSLSLLKEAVLVERDELLKQPPAHVRTEDLAACDRILAKIAHRAIEEAVR